MSCSRFIPVPENRSALLAVQNIAVCLRSGRLEQAANPLFLHGPSGSGKTHLVTALAEEARAVSPNSTVTLLQVHELEPLLRAPASTSVEESNGPEVLRQSDLLVVEDVHYFCCRRVRAEGAAILERLVQLLDYLKARERQLVFTARTGPSQLAQFPTRLASRLGAGLVVGLEPLQLSSRLDFLRQKARDRQLALDADVLTWIGIHTTGSIRQLEGALEQVEALSRTYAGPITVALLEDHLHHAGPESLTVEGIADRVSRYFGVKRRHLQSKQRYREVLMPRQVSMYLARELTSLSLEEIGSFFGGRDHSTVLHACRKVQGVLAWDPGLQGAIRELQAELG